MPNHQPVLYELLTMFGYITKFIFNKKDLDVYKIRALFWQKYIFIRISHNFKYSMVNNSGVGEFF